MLRIAPVRTAVVGITTSAAETAPAMPRGCVMPCSVMAVIDIARRVQRAGRANVTKYQVAQATPGM